MTGSRWVVVDPDNGVPPWRQIRDQLVHLIRSGALSAGTPFPPIRQLARDLGLSAGTVARVYRELETGGLLVTARRRGTVVADLPPHASPPDPLADAAARFVAEVRALGGDEHAAEAAVRAAWSD
ncbi:GntR family transcriptional regulator [Actinosynnema sp. NPDC023587]|uniref:GntR family transcriptional regulator n=1 Tax=Actinosynnema sp. NPDC023587 TaxID=3154695 RepID=UPI00340CD78C